MWKITLTRTSDPIRPTRRGPDANRPTGVTSGGDASRGYFWLPTINSLVLVPNYSVVNTVLTVKGTDSSFTEKDSRKKYITADIRIYIFGIWSINELQAISKLTPVATIYSLSHKNVTRSSTISWIRTVRLQTIIRPITKTLPSTGFLFSHLIYVTASSLYLRNHRTRIHKFSSEQHLVLQHYICSYVLSIKVCVRISK